MSRSTLLPAKRGVARLLANPIDQVEKHMNKWLNKQQKMEKTKEKIKLWRQEKMKKQMHAQLTNEQENGTTNNPFETLEPRKKIQNLGLRKQQNTRKLEEWKEIKQMKEHLSNTENVINSFSSKGVKQPTQVAPKLPITKLRQPLSISISKPHPNAMTLKDPIKINYVNFVQNETNVEMLKEYQKRDDKILKEKIEKAKKKKRVKSVEDIYPPRSIVRFNSSQLLTSSMMDESSYNNPTQASQAKVISTSKPITHDSNNATKNALMQIECIPRLRTPTWRNITVT